MPSELIKSYKLVCGCMREEWEKDMYDDLRFYTDRWTETTFMCEKHKAEKRAIEEEQEQKLNEFNKQQAEHYTYLSNVKHIQYIPLSEAVYKYRRQTKLLRSFEWVYEELKDSYNVLLKVERINNKWMCSKEKLDAINSKLTLNYYLLHT